MHCKITTEYTPLQIDKIDQTKITKNWKNFTDWRPTKENAHLCRLVDEKDGVLHIATDVTYKDVVGRRWRNKTVVPSLKVVTAIALVRTKDNHLVLIPRDSGDWEYSLECPGGFIRAAHLKDGPISIKSFIAKRICDDLDLKDEHISSCQYTTTYDAKDILEHMLVYKMSLTLTSQELKKIQPGFCIMPPEYNPQNHNDYTNEPLHGPSKGVILTVETFYQN